MKTRILCLFLSLLFAGCWSAPNIDFIDSADPALITKLGITEQDWQAIQKLASEEQGYVIKAAGKVDAAVVEVQFKKPDDKLNDQGGNSFCYERKDGSWKKQADYFGYWTVVKSR